jgi:hypothetical protein
MPPPASSDHALVGVWSLAFPDEDRTPVRLVLAADGLAGFVDGDGHRGAGVWVPRGPQCGDVVVAIRAVGTSARAPILLVQGVITVGPGTDAATLEYTTAPVAAAGTPAASAGPFRATGQRAGTG